MNHEPENPKCDDCRWEALRASVRPLVTLAMVGTLIAGFFLRLVPPDPFMVATLMILSFWFGQRQPQPARDPCHDLKPISPMISTSFGPYPTGATSTDWRHKIG